MWNWSICIACFVLLSSTASHVMSETLAIERVSLIARPAAEGFNPTCFEVISDQVKVSDIAEDEIIVETELLSVDAYIRTMLDETAFHGSLPLGSTPPAFGIGRVLHSKSEAFPVGVQVAGMLGAQTAAKVSPPLIQRVDVDTDIIASYHLSALGLTTGLTAYVGVHHVLSPPKEGEVVLVSAAAGAVGTFAAQFAKANGATVIGIAGGSHKCNFLTKELNLDGAIDYKDTTSSLVEKIKSFAPNGVDFFFDCVGGDVLDAVLMNINPKGRIVICGAISQYDSGSVNVVGAVKGPSNYLKLAERGATMAGFTVMQYMSKIPAAVADIKEMLTTRKIRVFEQFETGSKTTPLHAYPTALHKLLNGGHIGKMIVKIK